MHRHLVDLLFLETPPGELASPPLSHVICNVRSIQYKRSGDHQVLGNGCLGPVELEEQIRLIKKELDDVLAEAIDKYARHKKQFLEKQ